MNGTLTRSTSLPRCGFAALFLWALTAAAPSFACTCIPYTVVEAKGAADVVFAGTVEAVRPVDSGDGWEPRVMVDFSVKRIWKGEVSEKFSLHTNLEASSCRGMWRELAKVGQVLLVYGYKQDTRLWKSDKSGGAANAGSFTMGPDRRSAVDKKLLKSVDNKATTYTTDICSRTSEVRFAVDDFDRLGEFREFAPLDVLPDRELVK